MSNQFNHKKTLPLYQKIKEHIIDQVRRGQLSEGVRVPSEAELVSQLGVSRMTAHRALRELHEAGVVDRIQGLGTFVSAPPAQIELMELRDIAEEIQERGGRHGQRVELLETIQADIEQCLHFGISRGSKLYHSLIVNEEDGRPVQIEDRFVLPSFAPHYLAHDFAAVPSTRYLRSIEDATKVEHTVFASMSDPSATSLLEFSEARSVMIIIRRTWVKHRAVTMSKFTYPGDTYSIVSRRTKN